METAPLRPARLAPATTTLVLVLRAAQIVLALAMVFMAVLGVLFLVPGSVMQTAFAEAAAAAPPPMTMALACFASVATAAAWFWVLRMLIAVVQTVQAGDPFVEANISRLRTMWIVIAGTELFRMVVHSAADIALSGTSVTPADTGLDIRIGTWFLVLVIAALSEAFRFGAEMRREQELTI